MDQLRLETLAGCGLAIGGYPRFRYDASGGGGLGLVSAGAGPGRNGLRFAPEGLQIPALESRTTRFLGLPLPPGLTITIVPQQLEGELEPATGQLKLRFQACFRFAVGQLYRAPDLRIDTELVTGEVTGQRHRASGQPRNASGEVLLVGIAVVPPCGDPWLDRFLGLPDEALALLRCRLLPATPGPPPASPAP
ncbi:MAG: hypothetical protein ACK55H_08980 [Cyanobacteriota bacterium]|jgi:hypothetical protein